MEVVYRIFLGTIVAVALAMLVGGAAQAAPNNRAAQNSFESNALTLCWSTAAAVGTRGAVWVGNAGDSNYYKSYVDVPYGATSVNIELRGSMVSCVPAGRPSAQSVSARTLYATRAAFQGSESGRFSGLSTSTSTCEDRGGYAPCFGRGRFTAETIAPGRHHFTTVGNSLTAAMNVTGITYDSSRRGSVTVNLYRCPGSSPGTWPSSGSECYADPQTIILQQGLPPSPPDYDYYPQVGVYDNTGAQVTGSVIKGTQLDIRASIYNRGTEDNNAANRIQYAYYMFRIPSTHTKDFGSSVAVAPYSSWTRRNVSDAVGSNIPYGVSSEYPTTGTHGCGWLADTFDLGGVLVSGNDVYYGQPVGPGNIATCGIANHPSAVNGSAVLNTMSHSDKKQQVGTIPVDTSTMAHGDYICGFLAVRSYDYAHRQDNPAANYPSLFSSGVFGSLPAAYSGSNINTYYSLNERPQRRLSVPRCVEVLEQRYTPTVQILGNDLRVGSGFLSSSNQPSGAYGTVNPDSASWVEYAITAPNNVSSLASQSGAKGGSTADQSLWSKLTFANNSGTTPGCSTGLGCFAGQNSLGKIPNLAETLANAQLEGSSIGYNAGGGATISSLAGITGNISSFDRSLVIRSTGTITIDRDISYREGTFSSIRDIPQLVIIARNIDILPSVGRVDAWLIAHGTVDTCSGITRPTLSSCTVPLRINGPVMASQLRMGRTYHDTSSGRSAEEVNLRGDAYLWANKVSRQNGYFQTTNVTELPPRY